MRNNLKSNNNEKIILTHQEVIQKVLARDFLFLRNFTYPWTNCIGSYDHHLYVFFDNIIDVDAILENFTEEQLEIIFNEEMDASVCDDDYLTLLARYQSYFCPKKIDRKTIWTGSIVTNDAYVFNYELKGNKPISPEQQKEKILSQINTNGVHVKRLVNSNRSLVFRYTYHQTDKTVDIVFSTDELRG